MIKVTFKKVPTHKKILRNVDLNHKREKWLTYETLIVQLQLTTRLHGNNAYDDAPRTIHRKNASLFFIHFIIIIIIIRIIVKNIFRVST